MREGWKMVKLGEVVELRPPKREAKKRLSENRSVSFVPMDCLHVREKSLDLSNERRLSEVYSGYTYFADGDVLLAKITPCFENGKLGIARGLRNRVGFGSSEFFVLRPDAQLASDYLFYFLSQKSFNDHCASHMSGAVGHKRVQPETVQQYQLPLPPLAEQKRIVAILDATFAAIATATAHTEQNLVNAREVFEGKLNQIFESYAEAYPTEETEKIADIAYGYTAKASFKQDGPRFLRITDIQDNKVDWDAVPYCKIPSSKKKQYSLQNNDLVFARTGATTGKSYLLRNPPESVCASYLIRLRLTDPRLLPEFLAAFFQTTRYWELVRSGTSGSAQGGVNASKLGSFEIPVPPLPKQQAIVAKLDALSAETRRLENLYRRKLELLGELKQSLLAKAFRGELTAESDEPRVEVAI